jgi:ribonuclease HI
MEYRGIYLKTGQEIFHFGPVHGTNNIGEFLAIVHAMALMKQKGLSMPVYSDSRTAIIWVNKRKAKTTLAPTPENRPLLDLVARAETWLRRNGVPFPLIKWDTEQWGEIPADFGRK